MRSQVAPPKSRADWNDYASEDGRFFTVSSALPKTAEFEIRKEDLAAAGVASGCVLARAAAK